MKIGLIIATDDEFETIVKGFNVDIKENFKEVYPTYLLKINNHDVYVAKSGKLRRAFLNVDMAISRSAWE